MRERLRITITDVNGSRHFNVHQVIKKIIFFFSLFVILVFLIGAIYIRFLTDQVDVIENKKKMIQAEYEEMLAKNQDLLNEIELKTDELIKISDKIEEIEEIVGVVDGSGSGDAKTLYERVDLASITSAEKAIVLQLIPNGSPMNHSRVTSNYGYRHHPILKKQELHPGIDLKAEIGEPIYAPADGAIDYVRNGYSGGYGNMIKLDHSFGFSTIYAHLSKAVVDRGDFIKKGQLIGYSGNSGLSSGPHLHYEVRFLGKTLDPAPFISWSMKEYDEIFEKERQIQWEAFLTVIKSLSTSQAPLQSPQAQK